jgi:glycosyltransferase involved in cell wall biosynthesis
MVATDTLAALLQSRGFNNKMSKWSRGVDTEQFNPQRGTQVPHYVLYVGRVSHEKNVQAFLEAYTPIQKVVVGDGPQLEELKLKYSDVLFVGSKTGEELAQYYADAVVFAFPSRADTFGLVMVEALASGVPVAGLMGSSAEDVLSCDVGAVSSNMTDAIRVAATKSRTACVDYVKNNYTWERATDQFISNLLPAK